MSRRTRARNAFETTLSGSITDSSTTIACTSLTGLDDPCYLVLEPDIPAKREYIKAATISGANLQSVTRGLDGSTAGAQAHDAGTVVRSIPMHQQLDDTFSDIEDIEADVTAHVGIGGSQHPGATGGSAGFMSTADKTKLDTLLSGGTVTGGNTHDHAGGDGAQISHAGLSNLATGDPHTQYVKEKASGGVAAEVPEHTHLNAGQAGVLDTSYATESDITTHANDWDAHPLPYVVSLTPLTGGSGISSSEAVEAGLNITIPGTWASYHLDIYTEFDVFESGTLTGIRVVTLRIRRGTTVAGAQIGIGSVHIGQDAPNRFRVPLSAPLVAETATGAQSFVMTAVIAADSGMASWDNFTARLEAWRVT